MNHLKFLQEALQPLLDGLSPEERKSVITALNRAESRMARLAANYDLAIRDRAAVHALLKKTSEDLIQRYQTLFEYTGTAMAVIEDDGTISLVNSFFEKISGYAREEIENRMKFVDLVQENYREMLPAHHQEGGRNDSTVPHEYEAKVVTRDGNVLDVIVSIVVSPGTRQSIASIMDITERKRMEESLRKKNTELRSFINNIPDMAWLTDADSRYIAVNKAFADALGVEPECLTSNPIGTVVSAEAAKAFKEGDRKVMAGRAQVIVEENFVDVRDNRFILETVRSPILDDSGTVIGTVGVARDITHRKKAEEAVRLANKKLNLLSSITRHDVLNQLTVVLGYIQLARESTSDRLLLDYLGKMEAAGEMARHQITFTREYQEIGVHLPRWQDVETTILRATGPLAPEPVHLSVDIGEIEIFADPLLERVFYNLVENALRHGGNLTRIGFSTLQEDDCLLIVCKDDGEGVPGTEKESIFERRYYKNTGFGLFLAREILAITGLSIRETGVPGEGARFELLVPKGLYRPGGRGNRSAFAVPTGTDRTPSGT